jgi:protein involved in polysaccharide export with SLBB domain
MKYFARLLFLSAVLCAFAPQLAAQQLEGWDPRGAEMTRAELDSLLARLTRAAESSAYSQTLRQRSHDEAALVRERLRTGDFQPGDRILLRVEGEPTLTDTFVVISGPGLNLPSPIAGDIPLAGVLRSELAGYLKTRIANYVRDPVVHVRSLVRVSVVGGVPKPGFFVVPADMPLPDLLMLAGGWGPDAKLKDLRIERGASRLWEGEALQAATREGRTVDQLSLRAGDQIVVPRQSRANLEQMARIVTAVIAIPAAIYGIVHLFN